MRLGPDQLNGAPCGGPLRTFAVVVFLETALRGVSAANVVGIISAKKNVAIVHAGGQRSRIDLPLDKLRTNASHLLEAGGVEPPSEEATSQKTTCLFSS